MGECECGMAVEISSDGAEKACREVLCECGRISEYELSPSGWVKVAQLEPEQRQPLAGFSEDLRSRPDTQRFRFAHRTHGGKTLPVHILFCAGLREAEVKAGDMVVRRISNLTSPGEARRRWLDWYGAHPRPRRVNRALLTTW